MEQIHLLCMTTMHTFLKRLMSALKGLESVWYIADDILVFGERRKYQESEKDHEKDRYPNGTLLKEENKTKPKKTTAVQTHKSEIHGQYHN